MRCFKRWESETFSSSEGGVPEGDELSRAGKCEKKRELLARWVLCVRGCLKRVTGSKGAEIRGTIRVGTSRRRRNMMNQKGAEAFDFFRIHVAFKILLFYRIWKAYVSLR